MSSSGLTVFVSRSFLRSKGSWHDVLVSLLECKNEIFVRNSGEVEKGFCGIEPSAMVADVSHWRSFFSLWRSFRVTPLLLLSQWYIFLQNEIWLSAQKAAGVLDRLPYLIHFAGPISGVL